MVHQCHWHIPMLLSRGTQRDIHPCEAQQREPQNRQAISAKWVTTRLISEAKRVSRLSLLIHTDFKGIFAFHRRVRFLRDGLRHFTTNLLSYRDLAGAISCKVGSVEFHISRLDSPIRPNGRPRVLIPEAHPWINKVVNERVRRHKPVSVPYLSEPIQLLFGVNLSLNTLSHIVRQIPGVKVIDRIPVEKACAFGDSGAIDAYYSKVANQTKGVPRGFIVNMDEIGFADFVDARPERVIVLANYLHTSAPIPVDRSITRSTKVAGIAPDGRALKPLVIIPCVTIEREIFV
jgi:hypothetical protein